MARGRKKIAKGLDIEERAELMRKSVKGEYVGGERWIGETTKGSAYWKYWNRLIQPVVQGFLGSHPELTAEQKQWAVKDCLKSLRVGIPAYIQMVALASAKRARTYVTPVPAPTPVAPTSALLPEVIL